MTGLGTQVGGWLAGDPAPALIKLGFPLVPAPYERVGSSVAAVTYGHWTGLETDGYEWNFRPDAASGVVPTTDGQACVYASASPRRIGRGGAKPLARIVAESSPSLAARLATATPPASLRTFTGHHGYLRRSRGPGWSWTHSRAPGTSRTTGRAGGCPGRCR